MSDNKHIIDQLAHWKTKYFNAIDELELQKSYDELLERSLARLALAAQGLDPSLDEQLHALRNTLRQHDNNSQKEIKTILQKMEKAIVRMEQPTNETADKNNLGKTLAGFLDSLSLPTPFKSEASILIGQLRKSSTNDLESITPKLAALLDAYRDQLKQAESSSSFHFNLFGSNKKTQAADIALTSSEIASADKTSELHKNLNIDHSLSVHLVLIKLLEQVSLPPHLSQQAAQIRHTIQNGINEKQLPVVIDDISDIISSLNKQMVNEKREYELYLKSLTSKLNQLSQHIKTGNNESLDAFQSRQKIATSLKNTVSTIKNDINLSNNFDQLRTKLESTLDSLEQHVDSYRQSDSKQFKQAQSQIQHLEKKISAMEQESIELRKNAIKSRDLALKDPLTQLWNRQALNEILEKEFNNWRRYKKPLAIILWDLDHFKKINDLYGHAAGDKVLKTVAQSFKSQTRATDSIARYGGEEFIGVFPETSLEEAMTLAHKFREHIMDSKFHYEGDSVNITVSAGIAHFKHGDTIDQVFKKADEALYQAKARGRNCCISGG